MLDAVMSALEPKEPSPSSAPDSAKAADAQTVDSAQAPKADGSDPDDLSEDEISRLHHKTRKQINKLIGRVKDFENHVSTLRPKAEQFDAITDRIRQTGLDGADLNNLFEIGSLMKKGDLFAARDKLMPYVEAIMKATGGVLPQDLEAEVRAGQISEQRARELAEMRSRSHLTQSQMQQGEQQRAQEASQQFLGNVVNSVNSWEEAKRRSDPDWSLKAPEVKAALELAILKGAKPQSTQQAIQMAETALKEVEAKLSRFRPAPKPVRHVFGSPQGKEAASAPKSMLDAVMQAVG
jgi:hypothetical protein